MKTMLATISGYFPGDQLGYVRINSAKTIDIYKEICIHDGGDKTYYHFELNDPRLHHPIHNKDLPFFNLVFDRDYESLGKEKHFTIIDTLLDDIHDGSLLILGKATNT